MLAYCNNNPINYSDSTGKTPAAATSAWLSTMGPIAASEPTWIGEAILVAGMFFIWLFGYSDSVVDVPETSTDLTDSEPEDEDAGKKTPTVPDVDYPGDDPTVPPEGYEWRGPDPQGGNRGGYANKTPGKKDSWHPDLNHPLPKGPHWDYNDPFGVKWAVTYELGRTVLRIWKEDRIIFEIFK